MLARKNKYKYLHLIKEIALTDFKLKYQASVFGYLWSLVKPLSYFGVLYIVFTKIFKVGADIPFYPIYLLSGVVFFSFFGEATSMAMNSIVSRGDLIRKVYFPRIVLVIASSLTSSLTFLLNIGVIFLFAIFLGVHFGFHSFAIIIYILELYVFILGVSFYLSALFVKFRDIGHIWEVIAQILFYATPIVYSLKLVPFQLAKIIILSPLAQVIQDSRGALLGYKVLSTGDYWALRYLPQFIVLVIFVTGYKLFQKMAAKFAEEI